jgi:hypothetical protein
MLQVRPEPTLSVESCKGLQVHSGKIKARLQTLNRVEVTESEKHTSLQGYRFKYGRKMFYSRSPPGKILRFTQYFSKLDRFTIVNTFFRCSETV